MAMEMMELLAMLAQGREAELIESAAMKGMPPAEAMNGFAQQQPGMQQPAATTPPIAAPQQQGPFTSAPGSQQLPAMGLPGTQSGPAVESPVEEKGQLEGQLKAILGSGILPEAGFTPEPAPAGGSGPSLGSATPAGIFNASTPTPQNQAMMSLAALLQGQR